MSNSLDPDQARQNDLGPNCLQRLSTDNTGKERVNSDKAVCDLNTADQRLCFHYIIEIISTIPLLPKCKIFKPLAIFCDCTAVGPGRKPQKTGFLVTIIISFVTE